jgi:hypothetical protein
MTRSSSARIITSYSRGKAAEKKDVQCLKKR